MATFKEQTSAAFKRVAQEFNAVRKEVKAVDVGVKTINSQTPDKNGDVVIDVSGVKTVNGQAPDGQGNVQLEISSGASTAEEVSYGEGTVKDALDQLLYVPITINSFNNNVGSKEIGQTVTAVNLTWSTNKTPTTLMLDNETLEVSAKSKSLTDLSITSNKTWTLKATDEKGTTVSKSTGITFMHKRYWGKGTVDASGCDSAFVLTLSGELSTSKAKTFTVNASEGEYIYYAIPATFGTPTFYVGGFEGGFSLLTTFDFTNASGNTSSFVVYRSDNPSLGSTEVTVK